ncbi:MAG: hypothetical protein S4CHLAM20_01650 [Chlamydiia bacterium]|nr:hypothetical protein [Chlamydiia bacterium]
MQPITTGVQLQNSSNEIDPQLNEPTLTIKDEFRKNLPVDPVAIAAVVSIAALAALIAISFVFFPLAAAIPITIIGSIALLAGFGIDGATKAVLPSSFGLFPFIYSLFTGMRTNVSFETSDGKRTIGAFRSDYNSLTPLNERKIIVIFHGNGEIADEFSINYHRDDLIRHFYPNREINSSIPLTEEMTNDYIDVNYENCGEGVMPRHEKLVQNGIELVESLEKMGYQRENITLFGHSIGGTIAVPVKEHFEKQNEDQKIKLIAYHTLNNMKATVKHFMGSAPENSFLDWYTEQIGWDYEFTPERWQNLSEAKAFGGFFWDRVITPNISLAENLQNAGVNDNVFIRLKSHMQIDLNEG